MKSNESDDVDASILWLSTPFWVVEPGDLHFAQTVRTIETRLQSRRRHSALSDRHLLRKRGVARADGFPRLALPGRSATLTRRGRCRDWVAARFDDEGRLGEQFGGERRDPEHYREWVERWGPPAKDLTWSHAMYVVLCAALDGRERARTQETSDDPTTGQGKASK